MIAGDRLNQILSNPMIEHAAIFFDDWAIGHITRSPSASFAISGTDGEVAAEADGRDLFLLAQEEDDPYLRRSGQPIGRLSGPQVTFCAIANLVDCLDGNTAIIDANRLVKRDILLGQRILFAFVQSQLEGSRFVALDEVEPGIEVIALTNGNPA